MSSRHLNAPVSGVAVEEKVKASTAASYVAALVLTALVNAVQDVDHAVLLGSIPEWLETILLPLLPALLTFAAGWAARHTHRPDIHPIGEGPTTGEA